MLVRQKLNPTKIYVMNFVKQISKTSTQVTKDKVQTSKKQKSESEVEVKLFITYKRKHAKKYRGVKEYGKVQNCKMYL